MSVTEQKHKKYCPGGVEIMSPPPHTEKQQILGRRLGQSH